MSEKLKCKLKIRSVSRLEPPDFNSECPDCNDLMERIAALIETADQQRMKHSEELQAQRDRATKAEQELIVKIKLMAELEEDLRIEKIYSAGFHPKCF